MVTVLLRPVRPSIAFAGLLVLWGLAGVEHVRAQAPAGPVRPMTFLDMQLMRNVGAPTPSPDGRWMLYTVSITDWQEARRQTDVFLVSMQRVCRQRGR